MLRRTAPSTTDVELYRAKGNRPDAGVRNEEDDAPLVHTQHDVMCLDDPSLFMSLKPPNSLRFGRPLSRGTQLLRYQPGTLPFSKWKSPRVWVEVSPSQKEK